MSDCVQDPLQAGLIQFRMIYAHWNHDEGHIGYCADYNV